jgi:hypothetical protein
MSLQNRGAGLPDGGLFTPEQIQEGDEIIGGQKPSRGAIEVKPTGSSAWVTSDSRQVTRYWNEYGQMLVTNYRDFVLVGRRRDGSPAKLETYSLAVDEAAFWRSTSSPGAIAETHGDLLVDYLARVMLHAAPITTPEEIAWFLAGYARRARARLDLISRAQIPGLSSIRDAFEKALGVKFSEREGDHFFRSSLIQTLFYGVFSSWVLRNEQHQNQQERFDWRTAAWYLRVPVISALFAELSAPNTLRPLGLEELLDWTADVLDRVQYRVFLEHFAEENAVQYFYEPFLQKFDPALRKSLGVWYTPREVVKYQVARVDWALKNELGISKGLADENVFILDPCCGTGAYLVEVLHRVERTLVEIHGDALVASEVKRAAMSRVFGFELLPAPFVVAHLQLGLALQRAGAALGENERPGVYLTNALTGWEPPTGAKQRLPFPGLEEERDLAEDVKQNRAIIVILGNPPYDSFAKIAKIGEERSLTNAYRRSQRTRQPEGQGLNDLYVRFFRMAERRIVERTGKGIVCYISNYSWLDGLSHPAMRERYLEAFDSIRVDSLNGDRDRSGKVTPDGRPDPSVFSTRHNTQGIKEGTAVVLLVRNNVHRPATGVLYRDFWGTTKRSDLLAVAETTSDGDYEAVQPHPALGLPFMPVRMGESYLSWPLLTEQMPRYFPGVKTSRDPLVVDIDRDRLEERMRNYLDASISNDEMARLAPLAMATTEAAGLRTRLLERQAVASRIVRYAYRPFDLRWLYWEAEPGLLDRNRADYMEHVQPSNLWIEARERQPMDDFDRGAVVSAIGDNLGNGLSSYIPLFLATPGSDQHSLFGEGGSQRSFNLSAAAEAYLSRTGAAAEDLFMHIVAVLNTPAYRHENAGALRLDWPRVPLPAARSDLDHSARLGRELAHLFDVNHEIEAGRNQFRTMAFFSRSAGSTDEESRSVRKRWGYLQGTAVFPGPDSATERDYEPAELEAIAAGAAARGLSTVEALRLLGQTTCDVPLNDAAYWKNVPMRVWQFTASGYQVLKKWLSYREYNLLGERPLHDQEVREFQDSQPNRPDRRPGRPLHDQEVREFQGIARRIAAILILGPALDHSYRAAAQNRYQPRREP